MNNKKFSCRFCNEPLKNFTSEAHICLKKSKIWDLNNGKKQRYAFKMKLKKLLLEGGKRKNVWANCSSKCS